jgi:hypothetical protein
VQQLLRQGGEQGRLVGTVLAAAHERQQVVQLPSQREDPFPFGFRLMGNDILGNNKRHCRMQSHCHCHIRLHQFCKRHDSPSAAFGDRWQSNHLALSEPLLSQILCPTLYSECYFERFICHQLCDIGQ